MYGVGMRTFGVPKIIFLVHQKKKFPSKKYSEVFFVKIDVLRANNNCLGEGKGIWLSSTLNIIVLYKRSVYVKLSVIL